MPEEFGEERGLAGQRIPVGQGSGGILVVIEDRYAHGFILEAGNRVRWKDGRSVTDGDPKRKVYVKLADALLGGRRGRRLLLEFALESESILLGEDAENPLNTGMYYASYQADPDRGQGVSFFGPGAEAARNTMVTAEEVASLLAAVELVPATEGTLRRALVRSVDSARYWQQPDGHDVIAGSEPVRKQLVRVAEHLAGSADAARWMLPASTADQWSSKGNRTPEQLVLACRRSGICRARFLATEVASAERRAMPDRFADPSANFSGEWWSMPPAKFGIPRAPSPTGPRWACGALKTDSGGTARRRGG